MQYKKESIVKLKRKYFQNEEIFQNWESDTKLKESLLKTMLSIIKMKESIIKMNESII